MVIISPIMRRSTKMKFILALTVVALAAVGCGQNHGSQDRTTPAAPTSSSAITKANLDNALANLPGQSEDLSAESAALTASNVDESQPVKLSDVNSLTQQIAFQQNMLFKEKAALDEAYAARSNSVHLPAAFVDMTAYGLATGLLSVDAYRGIKKLSQERSAGTSKITRSAKAAAESEAEEAGIFSRIASRTATVATDAAPTVWRITEVSGAVILGAYTIGKIVVFNKDVVIRVSDTDAIRYHRAKVEEAQQNLANAQANLQAVYYRGERLPTP
jgi:hypothetical protein